MTQKHEPFGDLPLGEEETYDALAACYDDMTADVDYPAWADFIEALFAGSPVRSMGSRSTRSWTWPAAQAPCLFYWPSGAMK